MKDKWMAIFRTGDYGAKGKYTESDLDKTVELFQNEDKEVPITIDHQESGPAYGWVTEVKRQGDILLAKAGKVIDSFSDVVNEGQYRKRSIEIDRDTKRLRAVTFLGAKKPEIKDLPILSFSEDEGYQKITFEEGNSTMTEEEMKQLQAENEKLKTENQKFSEGMKAKDQKISELEAEQAAMKTKSKKEKAESFCEGLIKEGKIMKSERDSILTTFSHLDDGTLATFEEGDKKVQRTQFENYMEVLKKRPQIVGFGEDVNDPIEPISDFSGGSSETVRFSEVEAEARKQGISITDRQGMAKAAKEVINKKMFGGSNGKDE